MGSVTEGSSEGAEVYEVKEGGFAEAVKCGGYAQGYLKAVGELLRDRFYFPLNPKPVEAFFEYTGKDIEGFMSCLRGESEHVDRTFPQMEEIKGKFEIKDLPISMRVGDCFYQFTVRIVESKDGYFDRKIRFVLFSFYDNLEGDKPWNPTSIDEISGAVFEVLKQVQTWQPLDSLMTFSIGNVIWDGLKHLDAQEGDQVLPQKLIINRGLASIEKVSQMLFPYPLSSALHYLAWLTYLDGNPEQEMLSFFERLAQTHSPSFQNRKITLIEMTYDRYFSGVGGFDADYHHSLSQLGLDVKRGTFFVPAVAAQAHHALPMHLVPAASAGAKVENFSSIEQGESLADHLMRTEFLPDQGGEVTHCLIGGNRDTLDSITYLHVTPFLLSFNRLTKCK
ncbi:MAG: hypothetical protein KDK64_08040 [Chlamydiia bacterium]|nr:hypothetical protein [Chlamydiia bacterium]